MAEEEELAVGAVVMKNAISMAIVCRFCLLLLHCYCMGSQGEGCGAVDGVSSLSLTRDGFLCHGQGS